MHEQRTRDQEVDTSESIMCDDFLGRLERERADWGRLVMQVDEEEATESEADWSIKD